MINEKMLALGSKRSIIREIFGQKRSVIREIFEYGNKRRAEIGAENVFDFSLGNPSIPAPKEVNEIMVKLLTETDPVKIHGYTSAQGDPTVRSAIGAIS